MKRTIALLSILGLAALIFGCTSAHKPEDFIDQMIDQGWALYEAGNYSGALANFTVAVDNGGGADANLGKGYSAAALGQTSTAKAAFDGAGSTADAHAGLAAILLALELYGEAITEVQATLGIDGSWAFEHDPDFDVDDLNHIRASAYYGLGQLDNATTWVNNLSGDVGAGISLDKNDYDTWMVNSVQYPTWEKAILAALVHIGGLIG